jgi:ribonucleoside-diphosphate reductase alpha chain
VSTEQNVLSREVWEAKYRFGAETCIADTWDRVAVAVAAAQPRDAARWTAAFRELLADFRFLPGGRILAGAGTDRDVTLFNCFVMGPIEDSLSGIFDSLKAGALTMQHGGGVGYDFSTLRPAGTAVHGKGTIASGPVSFMRVWDAMCATMLSTGARRGAMMATLRCDHPDIEAFIDAKRDPAALRNFNLSVQISDEFMAAVRADGKWPLVFPDTDGDGPGPRLVREWPGQPAAVPCRIEGEANARELWRRLQRAAFDVAEPGVLFIDRINRENNLWYRERISATNPCGEIPLPPFGACNLGSLNLPRFVQDAFAPGAHIDTAALEAAAATAVRFLDNVIDVSRYPLPEQAAAAHGTRRLGLGVTGLADALAMLGQRYDSATARELAAGLMRTVCHAAYRASVELAGERGAFPQFDAEAYLDAPFVRRLPADIRDAIAAGGIRNSHLLAIAPAGTISLLANNVSSGIEPIFALEFEREVLGPDGKRHGFAVSDAAWSSWRDAHPDSAPPPAFVQAADIAPRAHLEMQAVLQPFVDNAISKTVNAPADCDFERFAGLYDAAYDLGLKGCTVFRPNPVTSTVLRQPPAHCCDIDREAD